ncbi:MAG: hypothetical protein ABSF93_16695 [Candidatus Sulfotelmatobacter sp.]
MNDLIAKAVAAFRDSPSSGDLEIYRKLTAGGLESALAARLVEFLPMAYCHELLVHSGVRFATTFQRRLANGKNSSERLLSSEPVWRAAMLFARDEVERGVSKIDFLAIAGRSAEFQVVNKLLNSGSKLSDLALTPTLLTWPEDAGS